MAVGIHVVNTTESQIVIFGIKFKPGSPTFLPENLLQKSETDYYMKKGILEKTTVTRVAPKPAPKPAPKAAPIVVKKVEEVREVAVSASTPTEKPEPKKPATKTRRRRRTRKTQPKSEE